MQINTKIYKYLSTCSFSYQIPRWFKASSSSLKSLALSLSLYALEISLRKAIWRSVVLSDLWISRLILEILIGIRFSRFWVFIRHFAHFWFRSLDSFISLHGIWIFRSHGVWIGLVWSDSLEHFGNGVIVYFCCSAFGSKCVWIVNEYFMPCYVVRIYKNWVEISDELATGIGY